MLVLFNSLEILHTQSWDQQGGALLLHHSTRSGHQGTTIDPLEVKGITHVTLWIKVADTITMLTMQDQVLLVWVALGERHHLWMHHGRQPHLGMRLQFPLAMPVTWRQNGLSKMSLGCTLPSGS